LKYFNHSFDTRDNHLLIDLYIDHEFPPGTELTLNVINTKNIISIDPITGRASLIFLDSNVSTIFEPEVKIDDETKKTLETTARGISTTATVLGSIGLGVGLLGLLCQLPIMSFLIKFVLIMKILNRLKLLNINFGPILGTFLSAIFNIFEVGSMTIDEKSIEFDTKTRGKFSQYQYDPLAFYKIMEKFIIYVVSL